MKHRKANGHSVASGVACRHATRPITRTETGYAHTVTTLVKRAEALEKRVDRVITRDVILSGPAPMGTDEQELLERIATYFGELSGAGQVTMTAHDEYAGHIHITGK